MRALRVIGNSVLWIVAFAGVLAGGLWVANALGLVQPLVVVSGSMEPGIMTGDLVFSTPIQAADLAVGDVATLPSTLTGKLVTHRVIDITAGQEAGRFLVHMKGDANEFADSEEYVVSGSVWTPFTQITGGGYLLSTVTKPGVVIPLAITLLAMIALSTLPRPEDEDGAEAVSDRTRDDAGAGSDPNGGADRTDGCVFPVDAPAFAGIRA